jgi:hypothetical protein
MKRLRPSPNGSRAGFPQADLDTGEAMSIVAVLRERELVDFGVTKSGPGKERFIPFRFWDGTFLLSQGQNCPRPQDNPEVLPGSRPEDSATLEVLVW